MAFTDRRPDEHRIPKIVAVGAFHAAIIYVLVTGLAATGFTEKIINLPSDNYPSEPPPPPPEVDPPKSPDTPKVVEQPKHRTNLLPDVGALDDTLTLPPIGDVGGVELLPPPPKKPPVGPAFTPRQPQPRNEPAGWVRTTDYPARDIREGNEGTTRILLSVDAGGEVLDCRIARSSGHESLDEAACSAVKRRARFDPATNGEGEKVAGTYSNSIRWVIPRN